MKEYNFSYSFAKNIIQHGVLYAIDKKENREEKFNFGSCFHMYVLEPEKFANTYATCDFDKKTKAFKIFFIEYLIKKLNLLEIEKLERYKKIGKITKGTSKEDSLFFKFFESFINENVKRYYSESSNIITSKQLEQLEAMKVSLMQNEEVKQALEDSQKEIILEQEIDGLNFKGVLDIYNKDKEIGYDLKTCSSVDPDEINRQVKNMLYDIQYYFYYNLGELKSFKFIFQETTAPYYTRIVELSDEWYARGEALTHEARDKYNEFLELGEVTAKDSIILEMPGYVRYTEETEHKKINWNELPF